MCALRAGTGRHIDLTGCYNFRDLGGYPAAGGSRTRWRRLFRADGLDHLVDADRALVAELGIRAVIDLRTDVEATGADATPGGARLAAELDGTSYHHLPLTDVLPGSEDAPRWDDHRFVSDRYAGMLRDGTSSVVAALDLLAAPGGLPAVFHCSVGKDRTGVLAAVVLGMLGVPDDVIVQDYALSRSAMVRLLRSLRERYPDAGETVDRYEPVILSAEPASMAGFIAEIRAAHGSFEGLASDLGAHESVSVLRNELLEPAS
jgi:protein-tyrosine phosphatase